MTHKKNILVIGIEPSLIDFSSPDFAAFPGMDATKVLAGLKAAEDSLIRLGYEVETCLIDLGQTAEAVVRNKLKEKRFDFVLVGAGIRVPAGNFLLFEKLINVIHEGAPQARICFNTKPTDTADAIKRWL